MTDDDIDLSDCPELTDEWFANATVRPPGEPRRRSGVELKVSVDPATAAWYDAQGEDRDRRLRAALRLYATVHRS